MLNWVQLKKYNLVLIFVVSANVMKTWNWELIYGIWQLCDINTTKFNKSWNKSDAASDDLTQHLLERCDLIQTECWGVRLECKFDRWIGAWAAAMWSMYNSVVVKKELSQKAINLHSYSHLWSRALGQNQKNQFLDRYGQNEFPWHHGHLYLDCCPCDLTLNNWKTREG